MLDRKSPAEVASLAWLKQGSGVRTVSRDSNNGRIGPTLPGGKKDMTGATEIDGVNAALADDGGRFV
jgi:hypothetical protein